MKYTLKLTILVISMVIISSCNKPSNRDLLVDKAWILIGITVDPPIRDQLNLYTALDSCEKDDLEYYYADGSYLWDKGELTCEGEFDEGNDIHATWSINKEQTEIIRKYPEGDSEVVTIETLNDTLLILSYSEEYGPITYKFKDIYKKQ